MFRFRQDIQSEKGCGSNISCTRSPWVKRFCVNPLLCAVPIRSVARAWGVSSRRDIVLNLKQERKSYKLIQVLYTLTHFEMYLFVILPCDSAQEERVTPLFVLYRYAQPERV